VLIHGNGKVRIQTDMSRNIHKMQEGGLFIQFELLSGHNLNETK